MVKRAIGVVVLAVGLAALPVGADAQQSEQSDAGVAYARIDTGADDPYRRLDFETAGAQLGTLEPEIVEASDADAAALRFVSADDLGGFHAAPIGMVRWSASGISLTGVAAPDVREGGALPSTSELDAGSTTTSVLAALPERTSRAAVDGGANRSSFSFTDDIGAPAPPPVDLPPLADPPAPPSEGIGAAPTTTQPGSPATTTTAPGSPTTTIATTVPSPTVPLATTTTTRPPTTTTTTRPPTTTTRPSTTTTTVAPPTTTTTAAPPAEVFALTQERPSMTSCAAPSGTAHACDALWSVPLAATGETITLDLTLRNAGTLDASGLHVWASTACVTTSTAAPSGSGDLCDVIQLTVQRYSTSARTVPLECVYGGGTAQLCSLSSARTLADFSSTYRSGSQFRSIGTGLAGGEAAHVRVTLRLPDVDNRYQRRVASIGLTWRQVQ